MRKTVCIVSAAAMSLALLPSAAGAQGPLAQTAEAETTDAAQTVNAKASIAKSGSKLFMEAGDTASLSLPKIKARRAKSSNASVASAKTAGTAVKVSAKKAGTATITAVSGKKSWKVQVTVKNEGAYTLETGSAKTIKVTKLKSVSSSSKKTIAVTKGAAKFTARAKAAGSAVLTAKNAAGRSFVYLMSAKAPAVTPAQPKTVSADDEIASVKAYGSVDLEGAKTSAIIVEYKNTVDASSVDVGDYEVSDYATTQEADNGFDRTIEIDNDGIEGNEGQIARAYVNDEPATSATGGTTTGKYVILEVNDDYMLNGQNLVYTNSMIAGAKQVGEVSGQNLTVTPGTREVANYTSEQVENAWSHKTETVRTASKKGIILPQFQKGSGWTLHYLSADKAQAPSYLEAADAFHATNCLSEYTDEYCKAGEKVDFDLPYSIYVPDKATLEANKGKISLVIHMEHAGSNDTDPMAAITSSKAATKLAGSRVQGDNPAIVVVPQVEEGRRSTNDYDESSEVNTAVWELIDSLLEQYKGYVDTDRIYGTGQSMGGMTILNMASQRDNFFAGIAVVGAQWSNSYNKDYQDGVQRSPENDPVSFDSSKGTVDPENYQNWYYMVSDDNILVLTCKGDGMAYGEWNDLSGYYKAAGVEIPYDEWDPYLRTSVQNKTLKTLVDHDSSAPGSGITWGAFTKGNHMSTWKYGYQLDANFDWLFKQNRQSELARGKVTQLSNEWLGRDAEGNILEGSGTKNLNSAQYTPFSVAKDFVEGWTPASVEVYKLIDALPTEVSTADAAQVQAARSAYDALTPLQKQAVSNYATLTSAEQALG